MAKLVLAAVTLKKQLNKRFPKRDTASDGWLPDAAHQARMSDHNPDADGWVHALDIDHNFGKPGDAQKFANQLITYARTNQLGSTRLKYVCYNKMIASGTYESAFWTWRPNPNHETHIHVSFTTSAQTDGRPFPLPIFSEGILWDGVIPHVDDVKKAAANDLRNADTYRVAARLDDLGYYDGTPKPVGVQGFPRIAVGNFQEAHGLMKTGTYTTRTHEALFP
jgi:hypothetical protein